MITLIEDYIPHKVTVIEDFDFTSRTVIEHLTHSVTNVDSNAVIFLTGSVGITADNIVTHEWPPQASSGAATLTLPEIPTKILKLYINFLAQHKNEINLTGDTLSLAATLNLIAGDVVSVDYII